MSKSRAVVDGLEARKLMSTVQVGALPAFAESAGTVQVPITLDTPAATAVVVNYSSKAGTAKAGRDFMAAKGSVTIPAGQTTANIPVTIRQDNVYEGNQTFKLSMKAKGATVSPAARNMTVTIADDEAVPTVRLADATVTEGARGNRKTTLTATLSGPAEKASSVRFASVAQTATLNQDFKNARGTIKFGAGKTTARVTVQTRGDTAAETDEVFNVALSNPVNAQLAAGAGAFSRVVVRDDDGGVTARPAVSILGSTVNAGTGARFTFNLSQASTVPISFRYATRNGTALAGTHFTADEQVFTIEAGLLTKQLTIPTVANSVTGNPVTFDLLVSTVANGTLSAGQASATVVGTGGDGGQQGNDNLLLSVSNPASPEGNPGDAQTLDFVISLSQASTQTVTVDYATSTDPTDPGVATAGTHFVAASGAVTFAPGETSKTVSVQLIPNAVRETDNQRRVLRVQLDLTNPTNATIGDPQGVGSIIDDDPA